MTTKPSAATYIPSEAGVEALSTSERFGHASIKNGVEAFHSVLNAANGDLSSPDRVSKQAPPSCSLRCAGATAYAEQQGSTEKVVARLENADCICTKGTNKQRGQHMRTIDSSLYYRLRTVSNQDNQIGNSGSADRKQQ